MAGWKKTQESEPRPRPKVVSTADRAARLEAPDSADGGCGPAHAWSVEKAQDAEDKVCAVEPAAEAREAEDSCGPEPHEPGSDDEGGRAAKTARRHIVRGLVTAAFLAGLRWSTLLEQLPGWRWDAQQHELRCPADEPMRARGARRQGADCLALEFRVRRLRVCGHCARRSECTKSTNPRFVKEVSVVVQVPDLPSLLKKNRLTDSSPTPAQLLVHDDSPPSPGPWSTRAPLLVPSLFRQQPELLLKGCRIRVDSPPPPLLSNGPPWLAADANDRQHRRSSHAQRDARCLLPAGHPKTVHFEQPRGGSAAARKKLFATITTPRHHKASG